MAWERLGLSHTIPLRSKNMCSYKLPNNKQRLLVSWSIRKPAKKNYVPEKPRAQAQELLRGIISVI